MYVDQGKDGDGTSHRMVCTVLVMMIVMTAWET
jgi:hypothetical protein